MRYILLAQCPIMMNVDRVRNNVNRMEFPDTDERHEFLDPADLASNANGGYEIWSHAESAHEPPNPKSMEKIEIQRLDVAPIDDDPIFETQCGASKKHPTSYLGTVMHMILLSMSPTLLNLPFSFNQVGYSVDCIKVFLAVLLDTRWLHTTRALEPQ